MILPLTAHPAFDKAAHYFGVRPVRVPVRKDFRADVAAVEAAITKNTVLLVGSAPSYLHGVVDPIADLARVARRRDLLLHVDACVGGMMPPFVRRLGYPAPEFDFGVPGVTSISADLHKYGYAAKGASVILCRSREPASPPAVRPDRLAGRDLRPADDDRHPPGRRDRGRLGSHAAPRRVGLPGDRRRGDAHHRPAQAGDRRDRGRARAERPGHERVRDRLRHAGHLRGRRRFRRCAAGTWTASSSRRACT
ncbi:MAG: aminotransferase class V-fold PLP-dependent enzyme [Kouleothrix sp.]|nr:aminotransferase class V-fold PLP-dependent enzyme [Kouleothrix sp.]